MICRTTATQTLILLQKGEIEWRSDVELQSLRARGFDDAPRPPQTRPEYCNAMATLLSPLNLVSQLARAIMSLRKKPTQSTDDFSLEVTACFTRFLNEARRVPSANSTHETAWSVLKIALFEAGLEPAIRLEMLKEDASRTYAESRARDKKHAAHLDMPSSPTVSAAQSVPSTVSPNQMDTQIHQLNEAIRDLRHSLHSPKASSAAVSLLR